MKVAVMGAGAVGCYYGAMLALAGHEVVLIGRAPFVDAVTQNGLILEKGGERLVAKVSASKDPSTIRGADIVMVCVKSGDTGEAGQQIAPHLASGCTVLSLQLVEELLQREEALFVPGSPQPSGGPWNAGVKVSYAIAFRLFSVVRHVF